MTKYRFTPTAFSRAKFGLYSDLYEGDGMTPLMETVLGISSYRRHIIAQDPLCGGKRIGEVRIIVNPDEQEPRLWEFADIGTVERVD